MKRIDNLLMVSDMLLLGMLLGMLLGTIPGRYFVYMHLDIDIGPESSDVLVEGES